MRLNTRGHRALRRYCLRNRHATMMDIATWAREYFGKSLSVNTVRRRVNKCNLKLYYAKRKAFIKFAQKRRRVHWSQSHLRWTEKCSLVRRVQITACFWEKRTLDYMCQRSSDHPDCYQRKELQQCYNSVASLA